MEHPVRVELTSAGYNAAVLPLNDRCLVPHKGLEPLSTGLKVPHPSPLDECDIGLRGGTRTRKPVQH